MELGFGLSFGLGGLVGSRTCSLVLSNPAPHSHLSLDTHQSGVGGDLTTDAGRGDLPSTPEGDGVRTVFSLVEECRLSSRYSEAMELFETASLLF